MRSFLRTFFARENREKLAIRRYRQNLSSQIYYINCALYVFNIIASRVRRKQWKGSVQHFTFRSLSGNLRGYLRRCQVYTIHCFFFFDKYETHKGSWAFDKAREKLQQLRTVKTGNVSRGTHAKLRVNNRNLTIVAGHES